MTLGEITLKVRALTNTDTVSYPDALLLIDINLWYQKAASMILESMDESDFDDGRATDYPIMTTSLVASQRDYSIPVAEKMLKIKRVDIAYNGLDFNRALPIDDGVPLFDMGANPTTTDQNFIKQAPRYDIKYNALWLYPMPLAADTGGFLRVEWERQVTEFSSAELTAGTAVPGFDDPFHPIIAWGAAWEYSTSRQLPQTTQIQATLADYEVRLRQAYGRKELDRTLSLGSSYGDDYGR